MSTKCRLSLSDSLCYIHTRLAELQCTVPERRKEAKHEYWCPVLHRRCQVIAVVDERDKEGIEKVQEGDDGERHKDFPGGEDVATLDLDRRRGEGL